MTKDMTTGSPVRLIISFSIPLLIGNIFQQFYSMVDTIIVGRYVGPDALAAVGATGSLSFLVLGFVMGLTGGLAVLIAQRFGAGDMDGMRHATAMAILLCAGITVVLTVLSALFTRPLLALMQTPENIFEDSYRYIIIIFLGVAAPMFYNMISSVLRALGDSKTPLYFLIVSSVLNVVLDFIFILNFSMGVAGAAVATVLSQGVSGLLCLLYMVKRYKILAFHKQDWRMDAPLCANHLKISLPMAFQFSITAIGGIVLQGAINSFGSSVVAAYTAACKVEQLANQPLVTFGATMATYSAQNLGAGNIDRIRTGVNRCVVISMIFSAASALLILFFGGAFVQLFLSGDQPVIMQYARQYLNTIAGFVFVLGLLFIYRNVLQGIGYGFVPMMAGACELVARVLVALLLARYIGYTAICLAGPLAWISAAIPLAASYFYHMRILRARARQNAL